MEDDPPQEAVFRTDVALLAHIKAARNRKLLLAAGVAVIAASATIALILLLPGVLADQGLNMSELLDDGDVFMQTDNTYRGGVVLRGLAGVYRVSYTNITSMEVKLKKLKAKTLPLNFKKYSIGGDKDTQSLSLPKAGLYVTEYGSYDDSEGLIAVQYSDCFFHDVDYPGMDLNLQTGSTTDKQKDAKTCQELCANRTGCTFFTWKETTEECWLKTSNSVSSSQKGSISGPRDCGSDLSLEGFKLTGNKHVPAGKKTFIINVIKDELEVKMQHANIGFKNARWVTDYSVLSYTRDTFKIKHATRSSWDCEFHHISRFKGLILQ